MEQKRERAIIKIKDICNKINTFVNILSNNKNLTKINKSQKYKKMIR